MRQVQSFPWGVLSYQVYQVVAIGCAYTVMEDYSIAVLQFLHEVSCPAPLPGKMTLLCGLLAKLPIALRLDGPSTSPAISE